MTATPKFVQTEWTPLLSHGEESNMEPQVVPGSAETPILLSYKEWLQIKRKRYTCPFNGKSNSGRNLDGWKSHIIKHLLRLGQPEKIIMECQGSGCSEVFVADYGLAPCWNWERIINHISTHYLEYNPWAPNRLNTIVLQLLSRMYPYNRECDIFLQVGSCSRPVVSLYSTERKNKRSISYPTTTSKEKLTLFETCPSHSGSLGCNSLIFRNVNDTVPVTESRPPTPSIDPEDPGGQKFGCANSYSKFGDVKHMTAGTLSPLDSIKEDGTESTEVPVFDDDEESQLNKAFQHTESTSTQEEDLKNDDAREANEETATELAYPKSTIEGDCEDENDLDLPGTLSTESLTDETSSMTSSHSDFDKQSESVRKFKWLNLTAVLQPFSFETFSVLLGALTRGAASDGGQQIYSSQGESSTSKPNENSRPGNRNGKQHHQDRDENGSDYGDEDKGRKRRRGPGDADDFIDVGRRLACPFFKKTPEAQTRFPSCKGKGFDNMHRFK
jgi:hypothetical protein